MEDWDDYTTDLPSTHSWSARTPEDIRRIQDQRRRVNERLSRVARASREGSARFPPVVGARQLPPGRSFARHLPQDAGTARAISDAFAIQGQLFARPSRKAPRRGRPGRRPPRLTATEEEYQQLDLWGDA